MPGWLIAVLLMASIPLGIVFGTWIGRSWSTLPSIAPGARVEFKGPEIGSVYRFQVSRIETTQVTRGGITGGETVIELTGGPRPVAGKRKMKRGSMSGGPK